MARKLDADQLESFFNPIFEPCAVDWLYRDLNQPTCFVLKREILCTKHGARKEATNKGCARRAQALGIDQF